MALDVAFTRHGYQADKCNAWPLRVACRWIRR